MTEYQIFVQIIQNRYSFHPQWDGGLSSRFYHLDPRLLFTSHLQRGMSNLIAETQSGFLKGGSLHKDIRLVMDIIEFRDQTEDDGFLFFPDYFDSVEHHLFSWH